MDGLLVVLKPPGMTSHDVIDFARRVLGVRRIGHTGTLDPGVAGVLLLCVGKATRLAEYLLDCSKEYRGEMIFGVRTDTHDAFGTIIERQDAADISLEQVKSVLTRFHGRLQQIPPMTSARRYRGKRLYDLARRGVEVSRPPRDIVVYSLAALEWVPGSCPRLGFHVRCSSGTYVRTLCADIGSDLGVGAHLGFLVRTRSGPFDLSEASTLEEIETAAGDDRVAELLLPMDEGVRHLARLRLDANEAAAVTKGVQPAPCSPGDIQAAEKGGYDGQAPGKRPVALLSPEGRLVAVARMTSWGEQVLLKLEKVFASGDE